eukprot:TRINITY_DN26205_c0_g1_i1.p1 TRINITY_DN26205_c0_g1~~TRINITY_DN26205_c0_g1_i1.p1  ORF type:complete len:502 (-),score=90.06 TRINITY_DN26205_c0_g1_i1:105-1610(-)
MARAQEVSLQPVADEQGGIDEPLAGHHPSGPEVNPIFAEMETPWANSKVFVMDAVCLIIISVFAGCLALGYGYVVGDMLNDWLTSVGGKPYPDAFMSGELGCWQWILCIWGGCTVVGVMKAVLGLDQFDSFLVEIRNQHCESVKACKTFVCCVASLYSGAVLGPEAGLAAACGGFANALAAGVSKLGSEWAEAQASDERRRLYVLAGICAAFGTIMPSPWVALLICVECSMLKNDPDGKQCYLFGRRTMFMMGFAAIFAYTMRYQLKAIPIAPDLATAAHLAGTVYDNSMPFKAMILGAIGAVTALAYAIIGAVVKKIFVVLAKMLESSLGKPGRIIVLCSLAGLITGVLGYLVPLSISSGKETMFPTIAHGGFVSPDKVTLATSTLFWIAICKAVGYSAAAAGGLVGGPFFPILYIGVCVGEMAARINLINFGQFPATLTVPVTMVAVPAAVFPTPFTFVAIPLSYFHLGPLWCVPILMGILTSYTLIVGSGLVEKLAKK